MGHTRLSPLLTSRWLINGVVIALCAFFSAKATGHLVMALLPTIPAPRASSSPGFRTAATAAPDVNLLVQRNIFCSTCEKDVIPGDLPPDAAESGDRKMTRTSLKLKLIATLIARGNDLPYAAIVDTENDEAQLYTIGSKVPGDAMVTDISDNLVLLLNGRRQEYLELGAAEEVTGHAVSAAPQDPKFRLPPPIKSAERIARGIRRVGGTRYEIERGAFNEMLSNTTAFARSTRIVPVMEKGAFAGIRVYPSVGSVPSLLGLFAGDTIKAVNGKPLPSADRALMMLSQLRRANHMTLTFARKGVELTHEYQIR